MNEWIWQLSHCPHQAKCLINSFNHKVSSFRNPMVKLCQFFKTTPPRVFREKGKRYLAGVNSIADFPSVIPLKQNPNNDPSLCSPMILNSTLQAKRGADMAVNAVELDDQFCGGLWMGVERCWLYFVCWTVGCNDSNQSNSMYFSVTCTFM